MLKYISKVLGIQNIYNINNKKSIILTSNTYPLHNDKPGESADRKRADR